METFFQDLRYAARQLWKHPAFAVTAILTLALGIGANTAIFTVVQSILLAPLPYADASRIMALETHWTDSGRTRPRVTGPDAADVRTQTRSLEMVSMYDGGEEGVQLRDHAVFTVVTGVELNFPRVFGITPIAGRALTDGDTHRETMVSEQFARDNFGSAQAALGQTMTVEAQPSQIVGVLPSSFDFPEKTQVWLAYPMLQGAALGNRTAFNYRAVAKLRSGVTLEAARAELGAVSTRLKSAYPSENKDKQMTVVPLQEEMTGKTRPLLLLLLAAVAIILLIACVNVTHLEMARSIERQRELAVRTALGSSRWQLGRVVISESLLISVIGGVLGVLLAGPVVHVLVAMAPEGLPRAAEIHLNGWVLAFTLGLSLLTTIASSLVPARRASRVDPAEALKQDSSRGMAGQSASTLRNGLVVAEVAATFVLAVGAGLLLRTLVTLSARDLGFQTVRMLVVDADAPAHTTDEALKAIQQYDGLFTRLAALPGVEHVGGVMGLPTGAHGSNGYYNVRGGLPVDPQHMPYADFSVASAGYFQTMGIPMKEGRDFNTQDKYDGQFVAIISESLAKQSFGDANPIGKTIQCGLDSDKWMTVVGVVGDVRQDSPAAKPGATLYMPMAQHPFFATEIHIVLRTKVAPLTLMNAVQAQIKQTNSQIATKFTTMDTMVGASIATERFRSALISSFAGVALLLAMLGVYGTMAYSVAQRTFEIGVRMAFGAERQAIVRMILWHAAKLACYGIALGLALSLALTRLISSMLVGVSAFDPVSLSIAVALLMVTAAVAALAPAWRAARVDPMVALRAE
ncbi:ABC transporter permease [Acidobacterium sp. S8]|uniref:ABC transporter permease n=1 Tax=Acidobacterium sp. S8 TaxID=1641854 RepID=UPI00131EACF9|nr:ABC transporter permease [Acidobacterium sp. S8]